MSVDHVALCLLREGGPCHGYALHKRIASLQHFYPLKNVNVYGALSQMEQAGWVVSSIQVQDSRARRVYTITDAGVDELRGWLSSAPEVDDYPYQKDPVALRLLLLPEDEDVDLSWLEEYLAELEARIRTVEEQIAGETESAPLRLLTLQWRLDAYRERHRFLVEACRVASALAATG